MRFVCLLLTVAAGFVLYRLRVWSRLSYGLIQIAGGIGLLFFLFVPQVFWLPAAGGSAWGASLSFVVTLFAGLYVLVQGLDDFVSALREPW
jgi:hypothetical protein